MKKCRLLAFTWNRLGRLVTLAMFAAMGFANTAHAQRTNRDYYDPNEILQDPHIFKNVEVGHITGGGYRDFKAKKYVATYAHVEFALNVYPNHPKGLLLLSDLCVRWKSPNCDADGYFERAIELNPNIAQTYTLHGLHLHRTGRHKEALEAYKKALQLDPNSVYAHYNLGLLYFDMGQFPLSNEQAQRSYALGAQHPGLRDKLQKAGKWKQLAETTASDQAGGPAVAEPAPQQKN